MCVCREGGGGIQTASPIFPFSEGSAEGLLACVCIFVLRILSCTCVRTCRDVYLFFSLFLQRNYMTVADVERERLVLVVEEVVVGGGRIRRRMREEGAGRDSGRVIRRLTGEPLSFMLIEGACTELHRQLTCPSRCSLWFSTSVKTGSHFVSPLFICLTTQNIMEHRGAQ